MSLHAGQVAYQADFSRRLKFSFREHVGSWLTGALLTGGLISMLPARQKKVYINPVGKNAKGKLEFNTAPPQSNFLVSLMKASMPLLKPAITAYITKQLASVVGGAKEAEHEAKKATESAERTEEKAAA